MTDMTQKEFERCIDLYAADLSRWPVDRIKPALALMEQSTAAKAAFDAALALDDMLRRADRPLRPAAALEDRIFAALHAPALPAPGLALRPAFVAAPSGILLAALVLGFFLGLNPAPADAEDLLGDMLRAQEQVIDDNTFMPTLYEEELP